jgi:DNA-directed RNA polymerase beta subunit
VLAILEQKEDNISVISFYCEQDQKVDFCHLPKMNQQGNFIINGNDKVVVFQSVRAPAVYYFAKEENEFFGEIIPFKGP